VGVDEKALGEMNDALRASMEEQNAQLSENLRSQMFEEMDTLKKQLEEVSSSVPGQVEVVADGLEAIRREMGDKADADAIRQLEGLIGGLQVS